MNKFESIVGSEIDAIDRKPIGLTDASPKPKQSFFSDRTETNRVEMMKNEKFNHRLRLRLWQTKQQANIIGETGGIAQWLTSEHPDPAAPGSIPGVPPKKFRENCRCCRTTALDIRGCNGGTFGDKVMVKKA